MAIQQQQKWLGKK